jgi:hypothetical protein
MSVEAVAELYTFAELYRHQILTKKRLRAVKESRLRLLAKGYSKREIRTFGKRVRKWLKEEKEKNEEYGKVG